MQLQYIGARYIPIFYQNSVDQTANWQINVEYEPLTFVTTQNNHLYLSKKTVPDNIGTPADNTEYWLDMGIFTNAQIAELAEEVENLETRVGENENLSTIDKTTLVAAINEIFSNVGDIDDLPYPQADNVVRTLNWIHDVIEELRNYTDTQITSTREYVLNHRRYIFIGDSYAEGAGPDSQTQSYLSVIATNLGLTENVDMFSNCLGGASWKGLNGRKSYKMLLEEIENSITNPETITDIVVCGGVNDAVGTISDGLDGMNTFAVYVKDHYPNAVVRVAMIGWARAVSTRENIFNVSKPIYDSCSFKGFTLLDITAPILHDYTYDFQSDGVHPTQQGQNKMGWVLSGALNGKGRYNNPSKNVMLTDTSFLSGNFPLGVLDDGSDSYTFFGNPGTINKASNTWPGWNTLLDLGALTNCSNYSSLGNIPLGAITCTIGWNSGGVHLTPSTCTLFIENGHLKCRLFGENNMSISNVVYLSFQPFSLRVSKWIV